MKTYLKTLNHESQRSNQELDTLLVLAINYEYLIIIIFFIIVNLS